MPAQLDILALEPFYGGVRRVMLETVIRCSRHRWTLLKLPPRRIERRLTAAAHWFSEQLSRHWVGRVDLLFTSEAMNLADLFRLVPRLSKLPSVVYFHSNQLPTVDEPKQTPHDLVNLNTATACNEIWFNSLFHLKTFLARASAMVQRHPELATRNPMRDLTAKAHVIYPPIDLGVLHELQNDKSIKREPRLIFVETRDADVALLNAALVELDRRGEEYRLVTVGPVEHLRPDVQRSTISEYDEAGQVRAILSAGLLASTRNNATCDHHSIRALAGGCWPVVPMDGVYPELLPEPLHPRCLHDRTVEQFATRLQDMWYLDDDEIDTHRQDVKNALKHFDAYAACKAIDERFEQMVSNRTTK